jgi:hypothetical protein
LEKSIFNWAQHLYIPLPKRGVVITVNTENVGDRSFSHRERKCIEVCDQTLYHLEERSMKVQENTARREDYAGLTHIKPRQR